LLVEDDPDSATMMVRALRQYGARVTAVSRAMDALKVVHVVRPDILLSDIAMPEMDGRELIRQIRRLPARLGGDVPAIAVSAFSEYDDRVGSSLAGFDEHLAKPVNIAVLTATVVRVLGARERRH
jgi:CheY-like chemotaxis protein